MLPLRTLVIAAAAGLAAAAAYAGQPGGLLREATGSISQTLCTKTLASSLRPDEVMRDHLLPEPGMGLVAWSLRTDIDRQAGEVRTSVLGAAPGRAVYREGRGCTLVPPGEAPPPALPPLAHAPADAPEVAGPDIVTPDNPRLGAALTAAFAEPDRGPRLNTQAVVIVRHGRVIAERYADGLTPETALLSHSIAKSVVNALVGVLVREGRMRITDPAPAPAWRSDGRAMASLDNLLRMDAGLGFDEGRGSSIATRIWFTEPDTAAAAARAVRTSGPGERWGYCSRCYILLSRAVGDAVGGGPRGLRDFAQRELFDPLGMRSVTLEFDARGTLMGANAMLATPRDWARFGMLYLRDGMAGGRRILPEGWRAYSTRPTGQAGYGAGFWLNTTDAELPEWGMRWGIPGAPRDAFMARGYLGQYIVIVPSADLVVVRFGQSHGPGAGIDSVGRLVREVIAASV